MKFRTRHGGPVVKEHRGRVVHEMTTQLGQLVDFAEANDLERVQDTVWCPACQINHPKLQKEPQRG